MVMSLQIRFARLLSALPLGFRTHLICSAAQSSIWRCQLIRGDFVWRQQRDKSGPALDRLGSYATSSVPVISPVWSKYSNLLSHWKLRLYYRPRFGLSSAPLLSILSVPMDGKG